MKELFAILILVSLVLGKIDTLYQCNAKVALHPNIITFSDSEIVFVSQKYLMRHISHITIKSTSSDCVILSRKDFDCSKLKVIKSHNSKYKEIKDILSKYDECEVIYDPKYKIKPGHYPLKYDLKRFH